MCSPSKVIKYTFFTCIQSATKAKVIFSSIFIMFTELPIVVLIVRVKIVNKKIKSKINYLYDQNNVKFNVS